MRIDPYEHIYETPNTENHQHLNTKSTNSNKSNPISNLLGKQNSLDMINKLMPLINNYTKDSNTKQSNDAPINSNLPTNNPQFLLDKFLSQMSGKNKSSSIDDNNTNNSQLNSQSAHNFNYNNMDSNYNSDTNHTIEAQRVNFESTHNAKHSLNNNKQTLINQMNLHQQMLNRLKNQ